MDPPRSRIVPKEEQPDPKAANAAADERRLAVRSIGWLGAPFTGVARPKPLPAFPQPSGQ
jgi:hypothetical protein